MSAYGDEAIHEAVTGGDVATLCLLLDRGVDVDRRNCMGYTPLMLAVFSSNAAIINCLLKHKANINRCTF